MEATVVFEWNWNAIHALNPDGTRKYRYIINEGSSRSSKTYSLIDCIDLYARENEDKRLTVWRDTKTDCKKTVLNDTLKHLKKTKRYKVDQDFNKTESIFTYDSGSTFEIHGTDDEETVHGLTQDVSWFNEPYKISKDTFDQVDQRTADFIFLDWNPKKAHFIDDLKKDARTIVIKSTFKHNPFCPPEQKAKILSYQPVSRCEIVESKLLTENEARIYDIEKNLSGFTSKQIKELARCIENERKNSASDYKWSVYGLGEKAERPNRIFKWQSITDAAYRAIDTTVYYGVDWGAVDPWGIVEAKYYDGALYLREINYLSENKIREKLTPTELQQISENDEGFVSWYFDKFGISKQATIVCDTNRPGKTAALRRIGYTRATPASNKSILDGIDVLNDVKVYYTESSENLEYEQENYSRKVDRYGIVLDDPEDVDNHLIDPVRYVALILQRLGIIKKM